MKITHFGKVINGEFVPNNKLLYKRELSAFEGKEVVSVFEKKSKKRSVQQNAYYFGVIVTMIWQRFTDLGNSITRERTHEILRYKFLRDITINPLTGEEMEYIKSTTELTTSEAMEYYSIIQQWAATDLDIYIPDPREFITAEA